jgi:hypothetical protein
LIRNAIKFIENGDVKISASSQFCDDGQLNLHCSVSDSGVEITENNKTNFLLLLHKNIPQWRLSMAGLATCRQLVNLLDGSIDFTL